MPPAPAPLEEEVPPAPIGGLIAPPPSMATSFAARGSRRFTPLGSMGVRPLSIREEALEDHKVGNGMGRG